MNQLFNKTKSFLFDPVARKPTSRLNDAVALTTAIIIGNFIGKNIRHAISCFEKERRQSSDD